jgi:hypothetical protein
MNHRTAIWTLVGVLVGFKLWSIVLIYLFANAEGMTEFLIATHFLWFAAPVALLVGPAIFWVRLIRARSRRKKLLAAEWNVEQAPRARR